MSQISYIKYADIKEARRYDAEYFKPEYLEIEKRLDIVSHFYLSKKEVASGPFGSTLKSAEYLKKGVYFVRVQDIKDRFFLETENMICISEESNNKIKNSELKVGDLVISKVGNTIGLIARIDEKMKRANVSENNIGIKLTKYNEEMKYFMLTFFNSKYGQNQILRRISGNAQPKLNVFNFTELKIPTLPQSFQLQIEQIVKLAYQKQTQSKQLYREAEEILLTELGLLDYEVKHIFAFSATKKEIDQAGRYDAEYFQPKYKKIIEKIEKYQGGCDIVGEVVNWKKGIEVGTEAYTETGKDFIRVSDFSIYGISESNRKISDRAFEDLKKNFQPKQGEILFTKDGTIGISYVLKEDIEGILSGAFLRLTLKEKYQDFEKECLSLIFSSILCKMQVEKLSGGAIIAHLKPSDFETFKIPLIKPSIQKQIAEKIKESHKLRKESKNLLEEAKRKVEEEIEK